MNSSNRKLFRETHLNTTVDPAWVTSHLSKGNDFRLNHVTLVLKNLKFQTMSSIKFNDITNTTTFNFYLKHFKV